MSRVQVKHLDIQAVPEQGAVRHVLVVDDSKAQRRVLRASLTRLGYEVTEASSGDEALEYCNSLDIDLIISDWMMPGMSGPEFCQAFRALKREHYGYFILLTSKSDKNEIAHGLDIGADDFLTKPVSSDEILARVRAGERILRMERELQEKNRLVSRTLGEISSLYDALDRDLVEARKLQQSLVRERYRDFGQSQVSLLLRPSGHVGGDLVGFFQINESQVGLYSIDVSGHGVASALLTARLAAYLSGNSQDQNLAIRADAEGRPVSRNPSEVAATLNKLMIEEMETDLYFTMLYAVLDKTTGLVRMVQCGHPNPALQRVGGEVEFIGDGGLPIGLIAGGSWDEFDISLTEGERLMLFSDGITECPDHADGMLGEDGLVDLMRRNTDQRGAAFFDTFLWDLNDFAKDKDFPDDISAILLEYSGRNTA